MGFGPGLCYHGRMMQAVSETPSRAWQPAAASSGEASDAGRHLQRRGAWGSVVFHQICLRCPNVFMVFSKRIIVSTATDEWQLER